MHWAHEPQFLLVVGVVTATAAWLATRRSERARRGAWIVAIVWLLGVAGMWMRDLDAFGEFRAMVPTGTYVRFVAEWAAFAVAPWSVVRSWATLRGRTAPRATS